jgi:hypothetical protein
MSNVLAHIRVIETHGIRRFLYPLNTTVQLAATVGLDSLRLLTPDSQAIPFQFVSDNTWEPEEETHSLRRSGKLSFSLSLAPYEDMMLTLADDGPLAAIADPLQITLSGEGLRSQQKQFSVALTPQAAIAEVIYDDVAHLSGSTTITRNGETPNLNLHPSARLIPPVTPLHTWVSAQGGYEDGCTAQAITHLVSSKSMIKMHYAQEKTQRVEQEEIIFTLPFNVTSKTILCDFGVGGGIYGKLQTGVAEEITWQTEGAVPWIDGGPINWSLSTAGRTDYAGTVASISEYRSQCWFHLIDAHKALAVAINQIPWACRAMQVRLNINGMVTIAFTTVAGPVKVSLTYHFLNDVPAIAAATNPQSILLPPTVEVLT